MLRLKRLRPDARGSGILLGKRMERSSAVEQVLKTLKAHWVRVIKPLSLNAAQPGQKITLRSVFHPLAQNPHIQIFGKAHNAVDNAFVGRGYFPCPQEPSVDFNEVEGHILEHVKAGVARAKIIQPDGIAILLELTHAFTDFFKLLGSSGFPVGS